MVIIVMMLSLKSKTDIASIGKAEILEPLFLSIEFFLHIDTLKQPCQNAKLKKTLDCYSTMCEMFIIHYVTFLSYDVNLQTP